MRFLSILVIKFSNHVGDTKCTDLLGIFKGLAKFVFLEGSLGSLARHLIVYMIVDSRVPSCYMYIHENALPSSEATHWTSHVDMVLDLLCIE